jgi:hypothetical protein
MMVAVLRQSETSMKKLACALLYPSLSLLRSRPWLAACLLLTACSSQPYHPPQFLEADARLPGLVDLLANAGSTDVLLVHGMCTHEAPWSDAAVSGLATLLGVSVQAEAAQAATPDSAIPLRIHTATTPGGTLRFVSLLWSPLKQQLCYDQGNKSAICQGTPPFAGQRASVNATLKQRLIDDCLPDPLIYQGAAHAAIALAMRDAILRAHRDSSAPLVVISSSLGSKILYDTLLSMSEEALPSPAPRVAVQTVQRMRYLIMAANQLPLLALAEQPLSTQAMPLMPQFDSLQRLLLLRGPAGSVRGQLPPLTLLALTDPNDALSYTLRPERYAAPLFNVLVSNAPTWFGALEDPVRAHLGYLDNADVLRLIACGQPANASCR